MSTFLSLTIAGVSLGALFFLVAAGLSLIFGLMGVLNFAHGSFFLWGAYVWYAVFTRTNNFWLALLAAFVTGGVLSILTERIFIGTLYQRPLSQILVTLGLGLVLNQLVVAIWGQLPQYPNPIPGLSQNVQLGAVSVTSYRLFGIAVGAVRPAAAHLRGDLSAARLLLSPGHRGSYQATLAPWSVSGITTRAPLGGAEGGASSGRRPERANPN